MKKQQLIITSTIALGLGLTSLAHAGTTFPPNNSSAVTSSIKGLGNRIQALDSAKVNYENNLRFQKDLNLPTTIEANTVSLSQNGKPLSLNNYVNANANTYTLNNIKNSLQQFAYTVTPPRQGSAAYQELQNYLKNNSVTTLTAGIKASDSLYTAPLNSPFAAEQEGTVKPDAATVANNNNFFNFDNLIVPTAYTSTQAVASKRYLQYLTQDFKPLTGGLNLSKLAGKSPSDLKRFINSSAYQNYQLMIRSLMANRSIGLSTYNQLIAERTPIANLGTEAGITSTPNMAASPLQVEEFIATHRANSKQWYKQMAKASPATVQRETLFVLAEIEKQNYQAHLDRERMLAVLTALDMQSAKTNFLLAKTKAEAVNKAIDAAIGETSKQNQNDQMQNQDYNSSQAQQAEKKYQKQQKNKKKNKQ